MGSENWSKPVLSTWTKTAFLQLRFLEVHLSIFKGEEQTGCVSSYLSLR